VQALGWPENSSVEWQYLPVIGTTLHLERRKDPTGYMIELASSTLAEKAFEPIIQLITTTSHELQPQPLIITIGCLQY